MIYSMQFQIASARVRQDLTHIVIQPDIKNFSWVDFNKAKEIIPLGEEAAEEVLKIAIDWGRYAELFAYDYNTGILSLEDPE